MKKENLLFGIIGILAGLIVGYIGTDYINRTNTPASQSGGSQRPAGEPGAAPASTEGTGGPSDITSVVETARREPGNFEAQMKAGGAFREIRRFEQALDFYRNAVKAKPDSNEAWARLGDTLFDLQQFEEAAEQYARSLEIDPRNATVRMDLGLCWFLRTPRDLDRAIAEFKRALEIDSKHEKSLQNLTAALIEKGDLSAARQTLERLTSVNPSNSSISAFRNRLSD